MARHLDTIVVVDVESTCWEGEPPKEEQSEIIEIGYFLLKPGRTRSKGGVLLSNHAFSVQEGHQILVKPSLSTVSPFCERLTGLTQSELDEQGVVYWHAISSFIDAVSRDAGHSIKDLTFASWGDYDRRMFERMSALHHCAYPFGPTHLNVKNLFGLRFKHMRECSVKRALDHMKLEFIGRPHCGRDDAVNIAHLLWYCLNCA